MGFGLLRLPTGLAPLAPSMAVGIPIKVGLVLRIFEPDLAFSIF